MGLSNYGLDVRRVTARQTRDERENNVQTYVVEHLEDRDGSDDSALVQWVGAGESEQCIWCHRCGMSHPVQPACAHIEAVRIHLGFRELKD
jgi:hypothetical protein